MTAKGRSVRQLLDGQKYSIVYYQREYKWQTKHVTELYRRLAAHIWNPALLDAEAEDSAAAVAATSAG